MMDYAVLLETLLWGQPNELNLINITERELLLIGFIYDRSLEQIIADIAKIRATL